MTYIIIAITAIVSFAAFGNSILFQQLLLNPYIVFKRNEWYRLISHAFVHANFLHLFVNMIVLLSFGRYVESILKQLQSIGSIGMHQVHFLILYLGAAIVSSLTTLRKHKNDPYYQSVGASGAVSAIVFFSIFFSPLEKLYLMAIIPIPGIVFAIAYLFYSNYMSRKGGDNINHDAHFVGAVFGFIYPILIDPKLFFFFLKQLGL
ncbi:MAG: rhomboid family intramembrane serine protease [Tenuifilum sp.]|uniref:rhomboid family intramembrane serine protease n=1 Tax=Tenuifilum sp. TaxID=2760880 RepID=UPI001B750934|nr:rhomboid family intramembrane serine protease [Bacteroidales bacterium]HOK60689.1 rhomboid family intramembrane serine protease [Tenuifilum sp.]MBP9029091.1 rhomboid family intramembrane serine protease [Bacteroidales bacterium]HOK84922.1 rhomboid family intramembrane serine protease [Tenuifilum sp.]HON69812.1 rhomboid family intramembrane serine protease [Tenuifilum sp.]